MFQRSKMLAGIFSYFYLISFFHRTLFFFFNYSRAKTFNSEIIGNLIFWSCPLDIMTSLALALIPGFIICLQPFTIKFRNFLKVYLAVVSILICVIHTADILLFMQWGNRFNGSALRMVQHFGEITANFSVSLFIQILVLFVPSLAVLSLILYKGIFPGIRELQGPEKNRGEALLLVPMYILPACGVLFFFPYTGADGFWDFAMGFQNADIMFCIRGRENPLYNFLAYALPTIRNVPDCKYPPLDKKILPESILPKHPNIHHYVIDKTSRPNVILVISESFSSDIIGVLSNQNSAKSLTPNFDILSENGVLFTNFYASTCGTRGALRSIITSFPIFMAYSYHPHNLVEILKTQGYSTNFYYGGEANFIGNNMLVFDEIGFTGVHTLNSLYNTVAEKSPWGVYDDTFFDVALKNILEHEVGEKPFFDILLTLSNHLPFALPENFRCPVKTIPAGMDVATACGISYADYSFGKFIKNLQNSPVWDNTLIIFVADHGRHSSEYPPEDYRRHQIPMLWLGGMIKNPERIDAQGSQIDISATLLHQLGFDSDALPFSRDILSEPDGFSFFNIGSGNDGVFGLVKNNESMLFSCNNGMTMGAGFENSNEIGWTYVKMLLDYRNKYQNK